MRDVGRALGPEHPHQRRNRRYPQRSRAGQRPRQALHLHHGRPRDPQLPATPRRDRLRDTGLLTSPRWPPNSAYRKPPSKTGSTPELSQGSGITTKTKSSTPAGPSPLPSIKDAGTTPCDLHERHLATNRSQRAVCDPRFHPRPPRKNLHDPYALAGEDLIERGRELGVAVPDEGPEGADPPGKPMPRLRPCWAVRAPSGYRVTLEGAHPPGRYLHDGQQVQPPEEDRAHGEEITRQQDLRLDAREPPPGDVQAASEPAAADAEDPPHGRLAGLVAEAGSARRAPGGIPRLGSLASRSTRSWTCRLVAEQSGGFG